MRDKIFENKIEKNFEFDDDVVSVFDDMLSRSIPFYKENLELIIDFVQLYLKPNSSILDIGCSTANTLLRLHENGNFKLSGLDNSLSMINLAKQKAKAYNADIDFLCEDLNMVKLNKYDCILSNYTLQFIRPLKRQEIINKIYESINHEGIFILSEKIIYQNLKANKIFTDLYLKFKKQNGYSEFEIAQKRQALENVLVPFNDKENENMLKNAGFKEVANIFKWNNFTTYIGFKK